MRIQTGIALAAMLYCSVATPAAAAPLQPVEPWALDNGETQCTAARAFGSASAPITLGIVPAVSGSTYVLVVSEPEVGPRFAKELSGTVNFGAGPISSDALYFGGDGVKMRAHQFRIPAAAMEQARSAATVSVAEAGGARFEFALSNMPALLDALRQCTADLQRSWNVGATMRAPEKPAIDIRALFSSNDLPREALQKQQHDTARYQLMVNEKGAVAGCDVLVPSGSSIVDTEGCALIKERAKFKPAVDAMGKVARSVWTSPPVTWRTNQEVFENGCRTVSGGVDVNSCVPSQAQTPRGENLMGGPNQPAGPSGPSPH